MSVTTFPVMFPSLPNKKGRTTGWSQVKPEFAKIKVEQKTVNVVLQIL